MSEPVPQSYATHRRFVPAYHFVAFGILTINLVWTVAVLIRFWSPNSTSARISFVMGVLMAVALLIVTLYARVFALAAQDRIIRLEERMRMERLLPADLKPGIDKLRRYQFVALRFASDEELPDLVRRVLASELTEPDAIKKAIRSWRGDYLRV